MALIDMITRGRSRLCLEISQHVQDAIRSIYERDSFTSKLLDLKQDLIALKFKDYGCSLHEPDFQERTQEMIDKLQSLQDTRMYYVDAQRTMRELREFLLLYASLPGSAGPGSSQSADNMPGKDYIHWVD
jgi:hypothetical protein